MRLGAAWQTTHYERLEETGWFGWRTRRTQVPVHYLGWTVDGVPLHTMLHCVEGLPVVECTRMLTGSEGDLGVASSLSVLLADGESADGDPLQYDSGRTAVLFCPIDGTTGCATVAARITFDESTVTWSDFQIESFFDDSLPGFEPLTLTFDRAEYESTVGDVLAMWGRKPNAHAVERHTADLRSQLVEAIGWWRAGLSNAHRILAESATDALAGGMDCPALAEMAGLSRDANVFVVDALIGCLADELDLHGALAGDAGELAVRRLCRLVLAGRLRERELTRWVHERFHHESASELLNQLANLDDEFDEVEAGVTPAMPTTLRVRDLARQILRG